MQQSRFQRTHAGCMLVCKVEKRWPTQRTVSFARSLRAQIIPVVQCSTDSGEALLALSMTS